ncbi:MAG: HPr family phosphocarrier protein [Oscillospiraceae bacterium]|nr:HPr family phosphocarrier protein [Oscillospiraceae bacterium]
MYTFEAALSSIDDVKQFVDAANRCPCEVDVRAGRYVVNGKSILGMFSIDLAKPVQVEVHGTQEEGEALKELIARFTAQ